MLRERISSLSNTVHWIVTHGMHALDHILAPFRYGVHHTWKQSAVHLLHRLHSHIFVCIPCIGLSSTLVPLNFRSQHYGNSHPPSVLGGQRRWHNLIILTTSPVHLPYGDISPFIDDLCLRGFLKLLLWSVTQKIHEASKTLQKTLPL